ncbi:hemolysin-III related-domain-containing protein [Biscogniauxia marginata]|nr:hemolysin-III related-domain-containing protein [Biscogniauxia marginata]
MASIPPAECKVFDVVCNDWFGETAADAKRQQPFVADSSTTAPKQSSIGTHRDRQGQDNTSSKNRTHELLPYDELPSWYRDNPYIQAGYRPVSHSTRACLRSWGYLHNETVNIYSHLVPAVALLLGEAYVLLAHLRPRYKADLVPADYAVFALLLLAATACLGLSSAYHTLMCHSREVEARWLRLDFVGIVLLILGSFVSGVYVGFWCETTERRIYWAMIGSLALISVIITLAPAFQGPRWRTFRLLTFVCTGLSGLAPVAHGIHMFGFAQMARQSGLPYYLAEGGLFLLGAVTYALRFPERLCPGRFDIYGSSHQIFHVLVVVATVVHLVGVLDAFDYNYHNRQCSS